jgi:YVTN family beta-propeller protein
MPTIPYLGVIDTETNRLEATIAIPGVSSQLGVSPLGDSVFAVGYEPKGVWAIDGLSQSLVGKLSDVGNPAKVAVSAKGDRAYVTSWGPSYGTPGHVFVVDIATSTIVDRIQVRETPAGIVVTKDGGMLYVAYVYDSDEHSGCPGDFIHCVLRVSAIDVALRRQVGLVEVGPQLENLALNSAGTRLYATGAELAVIDTQSFNVVDRVSESVYDVTVDQTSGRVIGRTYDGLVAIDPITNQVTARAPLESILDIALTPDGRRIYAAGGPNPSSVTVLDAASLAVIDTIELPAAPFSIAIAPRPLRPCTGDCDVGNSVSVDEVISCVRIALGDDVISSCSACDGDQDGAVSIDDIIKAVQAALNGCAGTVR